MDDGTLLDRWRESRDGDAFAELARRHTPVVFDVSCRVLGERGLAEDILQEALLDLALEPTRKPAEVGVAAWLVRFAVNRARNRRAAERRRTRRQTMAASERPEEFMPEDALERKDELERVLGGCGAEERALLTLRFLHGWEYAQIASALSIHEGAARVRLHRALEEVRSRLHAGRGETDATRVERVLGALPLASLSRESLDASIRAAVEKARLRLDPASSRPVRGAVILAGVVLLCLAAVAVPGQPPSDLPAPRSVPHLRAQESASAVLASHLSKISCTHSSR
ncbi:MAG: sigma-70 family RNA polymerase sigma factor [Planctomycetes bacterium]|nr:sigma-70 family RNA polymerase sigma factor [Planctomycetota bacterium]